ncbi:heavy-metal-associated domain-containing protein [Neobacillus sp. OS1-2]|uniref:heavy-metal-associated domain-containing protein n=1 Tax=Neobacillus sp. OS1-2 TaxID=3070680 RepID=UPI0027DFC943|nr:heavy-metal-associated domain-containing protein [Neobacillus sp. OS1-2]WML38187.1 heavy-metal-associated domain-containing protein [Neobacillus sp. OS1-2]
MTKAVFQVALLDCAGCFKEVETQLYHQNGVVSVKVFPQLGKVRTEFDEAKINAEQLRGFMTNQGYLVQSIRVN